jgi:hypothetical protein
MGGEVYIPRGSDPIPTVPTRGACSVRSCPHHATFNQDHRAVLLLRLGIEAADSVASGVLPLPPGDRGIDQRLRHDLLYGHRLPAAPENVDRRDLR